MRDAQIIHTLIYLRPKKMEDDLKNGRQLQKRHLILGSGETFGLR